MKSYVTEGFNGNISYNGDAVFLIKQDDFKSLPINVILSPDLISSGKDQTALGNIKNTIVDKLSTRNTIITENDLNVWFATQSKLLQNINNSEITFRKEKDNLLKRSFGAYLLLRDGIELTDYLNDTSSASGETSSYLSKIVPTNTIDVIVEKSSNDITEISPSDNIVYNVTTGQFSVQDEAGDNDYNYKIDLYSS